MIIIVQGGSCAGGNCQQRELFGGKCQGGSVVQWDLFGWELSDYRGEHRVKYLSKKNTPLNQSLRSQ